MTENRQQPYSYQAAQTDEEKAAVNVDNTIRKCPVCGNGGLSRIHHIGRYHGLNRVFCDMCGAAYFALGLPTALFYGPRYNKFLYNPADLEASVRFAGHVAELTALFGDKVRGLEIGPGSGYSLKTLNMMGNNFEGIEHDEKWAEELRDTLKIPVFSGGFLAFRPPYRYNVICGAHVIEHFEDAHQFWLTLNILTEILGVVFLTAPDLDQSVNYHPEWYHFKTRHPWEHACLYGYRALEISARTHGFDLLKFDRQYVGNNWTAVLRKNSSITKEGVELDKHADSPPFRLRSMSDI